VAGESREPAEDDLLNDHVFAQFLAGVRADRLSLAAPRSWQRFLFDHGLAPAPEELDPVSMCTLDIAASMVGRHALFRGVSAQGFD
jgi:hypothetical protein